MLTSKKFSHLLIFFSSALLAFGFILAANNLLRFTGSSFDYNCKYIITALHATLLLLVVASCLLWLVWHLSTKSAFLFAGIVWGGAISNFMEFTQANCVRDYLNFFGLFKYNIADVLIVIGITVLIFSTLLYNNKARR